MQSLSCIIVVNGCSQKSRTITDPKELVVESTSGSRDHWRGSRKVFVDTAEREGEANFSIFTGQKSGSKAYSTIRIRNHLLLVMVINSHQLIVGKQSSFYPCLDICKYSKNQLLLVMYKINLNSYLQYVKISRLLHGWVIDANLHSKYARSCYTNTGRIEYRQEYYYSILPVLV